MDSRKFDRWTRLLAGSSRRDAVKLLVTGLAAGSLAAGAAPGVMAQRCGKDRDPCDERNNNRDCCSGYKCKNDRCKKRNRDRNRDRDRCGEDGDPCDERRGNEDCCRDFRCRNDRCRPRR